MSVENYINQYCSYIHEWDAVYEEYAKSVGLSYTGLIILYEIYEIENCTQKKLCEYCFIPKQTVKAVVTSFYKNGWIMLEEMPQDRRNKTIHLTEKGRKESNANVSGRTGIGRRWHEGCLYRRSVGFFYRKRN